MSNAARNLDDAPVAIELRNVNKWYGQFHVLTDINLTVRKGEKVVVADHFDIGLDARQADGLRAHQHAVGSGRNRCPAAVEVVRSVPAIEQHLADLRRRHRLRVREIEAGAVGIHQ